MKTNHQRNFKDNFRSYSSGPIRIKTTLNVDCVLADKEICPKSPPLDFTNGHRGKARAKLGMKKFVRTRVRFNENAALKRIVKEIEND